MTQDSGHPQATSPADRVDTLCDRFESLWHADRQPQIEDFLVQAEEPDRPALLKELLAVELERRSRRGERPAVAKYRERFAQYSSLVDAAFAELKCDDPSNPSPSVAREEQRHLATPALPANADETIDHEASTFPPRGAESNERASGSFGPRLGRFGGYELIEEIARGGMGVVYKARQVGLNRIVAVKMILAGQLAGPEAVQRFRREAEAAAHLVHPNIVQMFEVGEHDGQHFFSMEYVPGESLAALTRQNLLPARQAAETVKTIAEAVHFAHEHGVIHRDLKPANVLMQGVEGRGLRVESQNDSRKVPALNPPLSTLNPKITDFGLAKRLDTDAGQTKTGDLMGTPSYMAPEQAAGKHREIGPATDIYALGAILYELLTGRPPFRAETPLDTVLQVLKEEPVSVRQLNAGVPLDLETIAIKCLQKEPRRRYHSAQELAGDLDRFLRGEPITARPISQPERLWRWCRRNRLVASLSAAFAFSLLAAVVVSSYAAIDATKKSAAIAREAQIARDFAEQAEKHAEQERLARKDAVAKRVEAEQARDETKQAFDFLIAAFRKSDPSQDGEKLTVAELFDQATDQLEKTFPNQPLIQAQLLNAVGETYHGLGLYQKAVDIHEQATEIRRSHLGEHHENTLTSLNNLAGAYQWAGQMVKALPLLEETLKCRRITLGDDHPATVQSMNNLALAYQELGQLDKALPLSEETLRRRVADLGENHRDTLISMNNLALALQSAGQLEKAVLLHAETLRLMRTNLGDDHPETLKSLSNLANAYFDGGLLEKALPLLEEALTRKRAKLGDDHPSTLTSLNNLAGAYQRAGQLEKALPLLEETLQSRRMKLGDDHPDTLRSMHNLAGAYWWSAQLTKALPLLEQCLERKRAKLGEEHPDTLISMHTLSLAYREGKQPIHAEATLRECLEIRQRSRPDEWWTFETQRSLGVVLTEQARFPEAEPLLVGGYEGLAARVATIPPSERGRLTAGLDELVKLYEAWGKPQEANEWRAKLVQTHRATLAGLSANSPARAGALAQVGSSLLQSKQYAVAEPLLRECLLIREKILPHDWSLFNTMSMLGGALAGQKQFAEAEPLLVEGYQGMKEREAKIPPAAKSRLAEALRRLIDLYIAWDKPDEASHWRMKLEAANTDENQ